VVFSHQEAAHLKIKTQFIATMLIFGLVLAAVLTLAVITNQRIEEASRQEDEAHAVASGANELGYLATDYIVYRESQQLESWQTRYASFSADVASLQPVNPAEQALVSGITDNARRLKEVFDGIVSASSTSTAIDLSALQDSWRRLAAQSQLLTSDASRLAQLFDTREHRLQTFNTIAVIALAVIFVAYFIANYLITQRRALKGLETLQTGAAVIGAGNLDFRILEKSKDEIGELSHAFNTMAANLKAITATKTELEREVEERKQAEEALLAQEQKFHIVADFPYDWEYWRSMDNKFIYVSPSCERITGYTAEEFMQDPGLYLNIVHADDRQAVEKHLSEQLSPDRGEMEFRIIRKDGRVIWIGHVCQAVIDKNGRYLGRRTSNRDITERKKAEKEILEIQDRLKRSQEIAHLGSWELDLANNHLYWSDEVYRIFGLRPQEFDATYEAFLEAVHPDDRAAVDAAYSGSVREGKDSYEIEHRIVRRSTGEIRYVHEKCQHVRDEKGKIILSVGMVHDITERRKAEEELKRINAELEASNKELEAFSYSVSHDLRAPLRNMEGFSSALLEDYADKLDAPGKQYLQYVQESSDLMGRLIDDLLKLSRVTRSDMNYDIVDMSGLAHEVADRLKKAEPKRKVKVKIGQGITAYGDRSLLRLMLENLLGNAWKFTSRTESASIEIGVTEHGGRRAYFVRDNGVGFDMKYSDKLFRPFQRLHKATDFAGTGIGLATVQRIIRRHGGEVWAESQVGQGATFYFTLGQ
jgi:PAS domain S-box-containing protein